MYIRDYAQVICPIHQEQPLTEKEYEAQDKYPSWSCPVCGASAQFDHIHWGLTHIFGDQDGL